MIELYVSKGFSEHEASTVINTMAKHPEFFVNHMMVEELGIMPPNAAVIPWRGGLARALGFLVVGFLITIPALALRSAADDGTASSRHVGLRRGRSSDTVNVKMSAKDHFIFLQPIDLDNRVEHPQEYELYSSQMKRTSSSTCVLFCYNGQLLPPLPAPVSPWSPPRVPPLRAPSPLAHCRRTCRMWRAPSNWCAPACCRSRAPQCRPRPRICSSSRYRMPRDAFP
jgi:hypothetical protein